MSLATLNLASCYGSSGNMTNAIKLYNQCIDVLSTNLPHAKEDFCLGEQRSTSMLYKILYPFIAM